MTSTSIAKIVSLGLTAASGLYEVSTGIGSAGREVRVYATEIDSFAKLLNHVRTELDTRTTVSADLQSLIKDVVAVCNDVLGALNKLQNTLKPLLIQFHKSPEKLRQFSLRLQWYFAKRSELLFYREALTGQHRIIDTILSLLVLQTTKDHSTQHIDVLQLSNSVAAIHQALRENRNSWIPFGGSQDSPAIRPPPEDHGHLSIEEVEDTSDQYPDNGEGSASHSESGLPGIIRRANSQCGEDGLDDEDIRSLDDKMDQDLKPEIQESAIDVWVETYALQTKVHRIAKEALRSGVQATEGKKPGNLTRREVPSRARQDLTMSESLDEKHRVAEEPQIHPTFILVILAAQGREYFTLPTAQARTWEGFVKLVKTVYSSVDQDIVDRAIRERCFRLTNEQNLVILPEVWGNLFATLFAIQPAGYKGKNMNLLMSGYMTTYPDASGTISLYFSPPYDEFMKKVKTR